MNWKYVLVNGLTISRIIMCPVLVWLLFYTDPKLLLPPAAASWLLAFAFLTDLLDGFLARRLKVTSDLGCKLDSFADDLLFCTAIFYIRYLYPQVISENIIVISITSLLFFSKLFMLWYKHKKFISGMHTYFTKVAAFFQALFFLHAVFFSPSNVFLTIACTITMIALFEEILIIVMIPRIRKNIKGIFFNNNINEL